MAKRMSKRSVADLAETVNKEISSKKKSSGWSVRAYGPDAGKKAKDSFLVALPKPQVEEPIKAPLTTRALTRYQRKFKGLLKQDTWHGGWLPRKGGGTQDVSEAFPRNEEGFKTAYAKGIRHEQEAVGEVGPRGGYVRSIELPVNVGNLPTKLSKPQAKKLRKNLQGALGESEWSSGSQGDVRQPKVEQFPNKVVITPSREEMIDVYAAEEWRNRSKK